MKKIYIGILLIMGITLLINGCLKTNDDNSNDNLLKGVIEKGSLSNEKLISDTLMGVTAKLVVLGCDKYESHEPYVLQMPEGEIGSRVWKERWIIKGCDAKYPINITFQEDGLHSAIYTIDN